MYDYNKVEESGSSSLNQIRSKIFSIIPQFPGYFLEVEFCFQPEVIVISRFHYPFAA